MGKKICRKVDANGKFSKRGTRTVCYVAGKRKKRAETLSYQELRAWSARAEAGDYLARFEDCRGPDPGSRCGYSDMELDAVKGRLAERDLTLRADDTGLVVEQREQW
jgi:hypothetical protein